MNAPLSTTNAPRRNIFPGRCAQCGGFVAKFSGYRKQGADKAWLIYCEPHYPALTTAPVVVSAPKDSPMVATVPLADVPLPSSRAVLVMRFLLEQSQALDDLDGRAAIGEIAEILLTLGRLHNVPGANGPQASANDNASAPDIDAADIARDVLADLGLAAPREQAPAPELAPAWHGVAQPERVAAARDVAASMSIATKPRAPRVSKPAKLSGRWAALRSGDKG